MGLDLLVRRRRRVLDGVLRARRVRLRSRRPAQGRRTHRPRTACRRSTRSGRSGTATRCGSSSGGRRSSRPSPAGTRPGSPPATSPCSSCSLALIVRGVSFEWRGKVDTDRWRGTWSWTLTVGSVLVPLMLGIALGDLLAGLPINSSDEFTGSFWNLLTPYGVWFGRHAAPAVPPARRHVPRAEVRRPGQASAAASSPTSSYGRRSSWSPSTPGGRWCSPTRASGASSPPPTRRSRHRRGAAHPLRSARAGRSRPRP